MNKTLELDAVGFAYGQQTVLNDFTLAIEPGQIGCLLGPSGCGKSTLLRLIAGFEQPLSGQITIDDQLVADAHHITPSQNRQVGMLFQNLALFPHLNVEANIAFGLHHLDKNSQIQRTGELLELCRLTGLNERYPHQISGGQRQRVALARAMAPRPKLILLDEPFSSVESNLQSELAQEVKAMLNADQSTALWVTHSLEEALSVADRIGVVLGGQLLQWSSPQDLYDQPQHADVIQFLNHSNLIQGNLTEHGCIDTQLGLLKLNNAQQFITGDKLHVGVKKQALQVLHDAHPNATVTRSIYQGQHYKLSAILSDGHQVELFHQQHLSVGDKISISILTNDCFNGFKST